ncbi:MAG TPA: hypothetical protein VGN47_11105 [Blastococcus sp.]|jgi:hypothetical protein|nr:hypothetical protein [Blastococcus sp.]
MGSLTRRGFIAGAAGATALAALPQAASARPAGLPSMDQIWRWHHELAGFGTRLTGSAGHVRFTDWLQEKFAAVPGMQLHTDRLTFHRWLARDWSLSIRQDAALGRSGPVPVSYYYPYSGTTGESGVSGRLVDLGTYTPAVPGTSGTGYTPQFWAPAKGAIALVRVPPSTFSLAAGQTATGGYRPGRTSTEAAADFDSYAADVTNPAFQGIFAAVPLLDARNAGVRGVVCVWTGMSDAQVHNQYNPFITPYPNQAGRPAPGDPGCPALWVGDRTGQALEHSARGGSPRVTLRLTASITPHAATETVWGVLPGSGTDHRRGLIVNTHTDGPNVPEENGALGMLALARHFATQQRRRDLYFVMVTGHFQLPQFVTPIPTPRPEVGSDATSTWMAAHPGIYQRALAGLTVEHLGCTMWADDASGHYAATGGFEWGTTYTAQKEGSLNPHNFEQQAYLDAVRAVNRGGALDRPVATVLPGAVPLYLGEGAPLYAGGLGTVSLVPLPSYLLQAGDRANPRMLELDKLDKRLAYGQILSFARTIKTFDRAPVAAF